jgi:DNA polymerase-3 subunit alpha
MSVANGALRPAGESYRDALKQGNVKDNGHKALNDMLASTSGFLVYQEQVIQFLHEFCGYTMGEADIVRRGFAKKTGTDQYIPIIKNGGYLTDKSQHYIDGYIKTMKDKYSIEESKSEEDIVAFIKVIEDASSYLFSLNHSFCLYTIHIFYRSCPLHQRYTRRYKVTIFSDVSGRHIVKFIMWYATPWLRVTLHLV